MKKHIKIVKPQISSGDLSTQGPGTDRDGGCIPK